MRVFIPQYYYEDSFVDNVQTTLKEMGHEVQTLGFIDWRKCWSKSRRAIDILSQTLRIDGTKRETRKLIRIAREFKPELFLSTTGFVDEEVLEELGKTLNGRRVLWWGDCPSNAPRWTLLNVGWDFVYLKDRAAVTKLSLARMNVALLHEAMNPSWHKPVAAKRNGAVAVAGNFYAFRQALVLRLMGDGIHFKLFGPPVPSWSRPQISKVHSGQYVVKEEKSRAFGEALACLNTFSFAEGDSLNCRAFEIAGAGGLQLIEHRPAIEDCFIPGKELLVFKSYEELLEQIRKAALHPSELDNIRLAGARRALAHHTYRHRLEVILGNL